MLLDLASRPIVWRVDECDEVYPDTGTLIRRRRRHLSAYCLEPWLGILPCILHLCILESQGAPDGPDLRLEVGSHLGSACQTRHDKPTGGCDKPGSKTPKLQASPWRVGSLLCPQTDNPTSASVSASITSSDWLWDSNRLYGRIPYERIA